MKLFTNYLRASFFASLAILPVIGVYRAILWIVGISSDNYTAPVVVLLFVVLWGWFMSELFGRYEKKDVEADGK